MLVSVNQGMATISGDFLVAALLIYSLAVVAFAGDFAFGRPRRAVVRTVVTERVARLATVGGGTVDDQAAAPEAPDVAAPADYLRPTGSPRGRPSARRATGCGPHWR